MKYFFIAGEASGDLHAANLMDTLLYKDPNAIFVGLGGDKMQAKGCKLYVDYRQMAYMGFVAVIQNLDKVKRNFRIAKQALLQEKPDVLILIDYPSFNLKIAKFSKEHLPQTKIIYYIPPKVWAWKKWRVHSIAKYCDQILGIFPFEPAFYAQFGYQCTYVGNPTADCIRDYQTSSIENQTSKNLIAILPGSRPSEIKRCLPTMLAAARTVAGTKYEIMVAAAPGIEDSFYAPYLETERLTRETYALVSQAKAAIVNSGTATLETALIGCPQTAVYYVAGSKYLEWLLKPIMFRIKHFTLVNIISNQEIIQELIASRFTEENITNELHLLLFDEQYRNKMLSDYQQLWKILGTQYAANRAAELIIQEKSENT